MLAQKGAVFLPGFGGCSGYLIQERTPPGAAKVGDVLKGGLGGLDTFVEWLVLLRRHQVQGVQVVQTLSYGPDHQAVFFRLFQRFGRQEAGEDAQV